MSNNLINKDLFTEGIEPWPNKVFKKDFDAYFFLSHPAFQYSPNESNIFDPFNFLNNLQEKQIYISSPTSGHLVFALNSDWNRQLYFEAYKQNIAEKRFLFWQGKNEKWAMVPDEKHKVAIIGIEWTICDEVHFFFNNVYYHQLSF